MYKNGYIVMYLMQIKKFKVSNHKLPEVWDYN